MIKWIKVSSSDEIIQVLTYYDSLWIRPFPKATLEYCITHYLKFMTKNFYVTVIKFSNCNVLYFSRTPIWNNEYLSYKEFEEILSINKALWKK